MKFIVWGALGPEYHPNEFRPGKVFRFDEIPNTEECVDDEDEPAESSSEEGLAEDGECDPEKDSCWDPNPPQW